MKYILAALILVLAPACTLPAQVQTPITTVVSNPNGPCSKSAPMQFNQRTGQYWICQGTATGNNAQGVWALVAPANVVTTATVNPSGGACTQGQLVLYVPSGILYSCQAGIFAAVSTGSINCTGWLHGNGTGVTCNDQTVTLSVGKGTPDKTGPTLTAGTTGSSVGMIGWVTVPAACSMAVAGQSAWSLIVDQGTATVAVLWIAAGTSYPVYAANSISTSGWSISTGTYLYSTTTSDLTTTTFNKGDLIGFYLTAVSGATFVQPTMLCQES